MSSTLGDDDLLATVHANQGSILLGEMLIFAMLVAMATDPSGPGPATATQLVT